MKSLKFTPIIFFLILGLWACKKDDATYTAIAEVSIGKIENEYSVLNTDLLSISPEIEHDGQSIDESKYEFIWVNLGDATVTKQPHNADTIARTRNLSNAKMGYPSGSYEFMYKITEKSTGIYYSKLFKVTISSQFKNGFLVLTGDNTTPRLDMIVNINGQFSAVKDILGKTNSALKLIGTPYFLSRITNPFFGDNVYVGTAGGTNRFSLESFNYSPTMNIVYEFKIGNHTPDNFKPTYMVEGFQSSTALFANNNIYSASFVEGPFNVPINNYGSANEIFKASKWIAPYMTSSYDGNFVVFDDAKQKFYNYRSGNLGCSELPTGKLFDYHIKKKLIYMAYTTNNSGEIYALLKNNDDSKYFLGIFSAGYRTTIGEQISYEELNLPELSNASAFAVSRSYGYLFYAVGSKLYCYDAGNKTVKLMKTYSNRNITFLRMEKPQYAYSYQNEFEGQLFVGTYGSATDSGEIDVFTPQPIQGPLQQTYHFSGVGKIVDILRLY
ncbi:PKD-like family lipoprotein [Sphingobacterium sp. BIGb0165]|uniref:PKD-like family lipoprotein n=1 Tax=Sphingobacterium sp. BIGb0165 TaxID=2940615 RepID=UPI002169849E|nr:PKD-like family lipoprotein [Sphingobacterium sp. BIGb0165]MCS4224656.1 hypothetical protein [Sphingobacterium sp. BIGb0165]